MKNVRPLHVVTSVKYPWDEEFQITAHGILRNPVAEGVEGDTVQAPLRVYDAFQCDGHGADTDGCTQIHRHAFERVVARFVAREAKHGGVNVGARVAWRRGHPTVTPARTAMPGRPFEAEDARGMRIRVEAREILDDASQGSEGGSGEAANGSALPVITDRTVNMAEIRRSQADFQGAQDRAVSRMHMHTALVAFEDGAIATAREHIEASLAKLESLPWRREVALAVETARAGVTAVLEEIWARGREIALANQGNANAQGQLLAQAIALTPERLNKTLLPLSTLEERGKDLLALREEIISQEVRINTLERGVLTEKIRKLPTIDAASIPFAEVRERIKTLLKQTKEESDFEDFDGFRSALGDAHRDVDVLEHASNRSIEAERAIKATFDTRVALVQMWRHQEGRAWLSAYVASGGSFPGFAQKHWAREAAVVAQEIEDQMGNAWDFGELRYHEPGDEKRLLAAEVKTRPLTDFMRRFSADLARRSSGIDASFDVMGKSVRAPTAWVEVTSARPGNRVDAFVHIRNQHTRAMEVSIVGADGEIDSVCLGPNGRMATFPMENAKGPFSFVVTAVGVEGYGRKGEPRMVTVDVRSLPVDARYDGEIRHAPPFKYVAAKDQNLRIKNAVLESARTKAQRPVTYATQPGD